MQHVNTLYPTYFAPGRIRPNTQTGILPGDLVWSVPGMEVLSPEYRQEQENQAWRTGALVGVGLGIAAGVAGTLLWSRMM